MDFIKAIESGETENIEFKSSFNQETIEAIGAFANKHGGTIFIGLKSRTKVMGIEIAEETIQKWLNEIKSKTEPIQIPDIDVLEYKGKKVAAISVKESPLKPVAVQGRFFIRNKNSNHTMSPTSISDCLLQTQNSSWDYILDATSSIDEISLKKVEESIERINHRGYHIPSNPIEFLKKSRLIRDGKLTFAAEMLFAKDWHINTSVQMGFFQSPTIIKDRDESHGDLVSQVEQLFNFTKKHINCAVVVSGKPENELIWEYPLDAIREIILNMVVHRDYRSPSESSIKIFDDHIEFFNPGKLLEGMTISDLQHGHYLSTLRNKAIANHFYMLGEIEKYGSGITRIINLLHEAKLPSPKIEEISGGFRITIFTAPKVADKVAIKVADKVADKESLTNAENQILKYVKTKSGCSVKDIMQETNFSNSYVRKVLTALSQKELIEHRGSKKTGGYFSREQN